jgi:transcriptional regulator with XRE-family HTH domain
MNIGLAIKTVRLELDMSQVELSKRTGISQTAISHVEQGLKQPTKSNLGKICKALNVPESVLFILALDATNIIGNDKATFDKLYPPMRDLAMQIIKKK